MTIAAFPPDALAAEPGPSPEAQRQAKIRAIKGPDYPLPGADPGTVIAYLKRLSTSTDQEAQARYRQGARNLLYAYGRQYLTFSKRTRAWEDLPLLDEKDQRVTDNCILPVLRSRSQRLLSGPVQFDAIPIRNDLAARDRARLGAEWVQSRWKHTHMVQKLDQALTLAFCCGVSVLKSFWNADVGTLTPAQKQRIRQEPILDEVTGQPVVDPFTGEPVTEDALDEQGQPIIERYYVDADEREVADEADAYQYRPGDTDTAVRSVFNVRINPDATAWDAGAGLRWLLDTDVLPLETARAMFPELAAELAPSPREDTTAVTLERLAAGAAIAATMGTPGAVQTNAPKRDTADAVVIQEYWELPSDCFRQGRLLVRVGERIAFDGPFPDGVFPYTPIYDEPAPLTPMGRPSVNDMVSLQDTINRQWTAIDGEARLSGIGRWVAWELPGVPEQLTPEDRTVIQIPLNGKTMGRSLRDMFHRLDPAQVGGDRWRLLDSAKRALQDIAAFHEVSRGQVPPGVDSGVAIEHLLEEERGQLAKAIRALQTSLIHWAGVQLSIARARYGADTARWLSSERADMGYILETVDGTKLPDPDEITIELQGLKPQSETAFKAEVKEALGLGLIDGRQALKLLDLGRGVTGAFESQGRHYQRARWLNLALERGEFQVVPGEPVSDPADPMAPPLETQDVVFPDGRPYVLPYEDDHAIHLAVLDEIILDEQKPWQTRQVAMLLKGQRRRVMDLDAADAAPPAPGPEAPPPPPNG